MPVRTRRNAIVEAETETNQELRSQSAPIPSSEELEGMSYKQLRALAKVHLHKAGRFSAAKIIELLAEKGKQVEEHTESVKKEEESNHEDSEEPSDETNEDTKPAVRRSRRLKTKSVATQPSHGGASLPKRKRENSPIAASFRGHHRTAREEAEPHAENSVVSNDGPATRSRAQVPTMDSLRRQGSGISPRSIHGEREDSENGEYSPSTDAERKAKSERGSREETLSPHLLCSPTFEDQSGRYEDPEQPAQETHASSSPQDSCRRATAVRRLNQRACGNVSRRPPTPTGPLPSPEYHPRTPRHSPDDNPRNKGKGKEDATGGRAASPPFKPLSPRYCPCSPDACTHSPTGRKWKRDRSKATWLRSAESNYASSSRQLFRPIQPAPSPEYHPRSPEQPQTSEEDGTHLNNWDPLDVPAISPSRLPPNLRLQEFNNRTIGHVTVSERRFGSGWRVPWSFQAETEQPEPSTPPRRYPRTSPINANSSSPKLVGSLRRHAQPLLFISPVASSASHESPSRSPSYSPSRWSPRLSPAMETPSRSPEQQESAGSGSPEEPHSSPLRYLNPEPGEVIEENTDIEEGTDIDFEEGEDVEERADTFLDAEIIEQGVLGYSALEDVLARALASLSQVQQ